MIFMANIGVLAEPNVTKDNWSKKHGQTQLFAHNVQTDEVQNVDLFDSQAGKGMLGRMMDILGQKGHQTSSISVDGTPGVLNGGTTHTTFVSSDGVQKFNPIPWATDIEQLVRSLNNGTSSTSGLFGETWSRLLHQALGENEILYDVLKDSQPTQTFPDTNLGKQLKTVAQLTKMRDVLISDRNAFYVEIGGFDNHLNLNSEFKNRMIEVDRAIGNFVAEMKSQGIWNDIVLVGVSEFARALAPNSGQGSDHGWGGNYFVMGGQVRGGTILGEYPDDFTQNGPQIIDIAGRMIPKRPWDSVWNGICQWFGVTDHNDLDVVLPNRNKFTSLLFSKDKLFKSMANPPNPNRAIKEVAKSASEVVIEETSSKVNYNGRS
mmetsp:Transcript_24553/g.29634  ORF Transcript_24553/g.29634 Transcript_24553/m.29634 type:complete len:376 (+) Transcript_24553:2031-3158(+)